MCKFHFIFVTGIRSLHQVMTTRHHKPPLIQVREKSCFCANCVEDNPMSQCKNSANGYVSQLDMKEFIRMPPYEDDENDIDIHDPKYSVDYEHVSNLVVTGECVHTCSFI